ncbi:GGDEF domain-containing protein [Aliikangiella coralliicola]|nr:GGDEF domain-containing protein [Aliikangiella coralliicola]
MDLLNRSIPGIVIYAILWPIIIFPVGFHLEHWDISWRFMIALAGVSFLRWVQRQLTQLWYPYHRRSWLIFFATSSFVQALLWGSLFILAIHDPRFEPIRFVIVLAIGGMASGAMSALNPRLWVSVTNVCLILSPGIYASFFLVENYSQGILITIYLAYLVMLSRRSNKEYLRAFRIESQLESQRKELERINKIDPLTSIFNRGHFNTAFEFQWNAGIRSQQEQSLLMIDVDNFKLINDQHGHLFGDECLIYVANSISSAAKRKTDLIARFGGEEFAVLLSDTSLDEAHQLAETIRVEIESKPFVFDGIELVVTVSIGVASFIPSAGINSIQLVDNADKALYLAKEQGRNCVRSYLVNPSSG